VQLAAGNFERPPDTAGYTVRKGHTILRLCYHLPLQFPCLCPVNCLALSPWGCMPIIIFYEVELSRSSCNLLHWLRFIVQSQTQVPSKVTVYIGTTHGIITDHSQFITVTCSRLSPFSDIEHCIMLTYFRNHWNKFRVLFPWKLAVRGRRHTDMVLTGKADTRHETDRGMNGEYENGSLTYRLASCVLNSCGSRVGGLLQTCQWALRLHKMWENLLRNYFNLFQGCAHVGLAAVLLKFPAARSTVL